MHKLVIPGKFGIVIQYQDCDFSDFSLDHSLAFEVNALTFNFFFSNFRMKIWGRGLPTDTLF